MNFNFSHGGARWYIFETLPSRTIFATQLVDPLFFIVRRVFLSVKGFAFGDVENDEDDEIQDDDEDIENEEAEEVDQGNHAQMPQPNLVCSALLGSSYKF